MLHLSTVDPSTLLLLKEIFLLPVIQEKFALAGGTALALQIGHRKSIDLDLFSPEPFIPDEVEKELASHFKRRYAPLSIHSRMLFCFIDNIKCDFVHEPFPLIHHHIHEERFALYSVADIGAMKLHTICGRGKKKDFFDIYALLQLYSWTELLQWFENKYGPSQLFFLWKSILYFNDAEEDVDIRGFSPFTANWEDIKSTIRQKCRFKPGTQTNSHSD